MTPKAVPAAFATAVDQASAGTWEALDRLVELLSELDTGGDDLDAVNVVGKVGEDRLHTVRTYC